MPHDQKLRVRFEGLARDRFDLEVPDGYRHLDWGDDTFAIDDNSAGFVGSGYENALHDGEAVAYGLSGRAITFGTGDGAEFSFLGFYAAAAWRFDLEVTVLGFRDGVEVAEATFRLDVDQSKIRLARYDAEFAAVDAVSIIGSGGTYAGLIGDGVQVAVDNLVLDFLM